MARYVSMFKWTEKGVAAVDKSPERFEAARAAAQKFGVKIESFLWTIGPYDGVLIMECPDEQTAAAFMLSVARQGNVSTTTMRAFDAAEFKGVLSKMK